jgi:lipopolysaccharide biosynthesis protein
MKKARAIVFYLPQFHPIPENDEWWEKGFTEWTNVTKAKPLFKSHPQPDLPSDLGFYDLRVAETREAQANLAREHGVEGFAYWHYWFGNGRRILDRVFSEVLSSGKPDFPFCLAWANMTWSGVWHGLDKKILIEQAYPSLADHEDHFNVLVTAFRDKRYICVDGKPVFIIYRTEELPDSEKVLGLWRELARRSGFPDLYLVGIFWDVRHPNRRFYDAVSPSEPGLFKTLAEPPSYGAKVLRKIRNKGWRMLTGTAPGPEVISYSECAKNYLRAPENYPFDIPCVLPNWDNTPRSGRRGLVLVDSSPENFRVVMHKALSLIRHRSSQERLLFIKSWNEWAEGNYLEPGRRFGHSYLKVVKEELLKIDAVSR